PGQVVVLHPDETHDGRAGTSDGFGYRIVYVAPARIHEAARAIRGRFSPLPFVREPVATNQALAAAIEAAVRPDPEPLPIDGLVPPRPRLAATRRPLPAPPRGAPRPRPARPPGAPAHSPRRARALPSPSLPRHRTQPRDPLLRARSDHRPPPLRPRPPVPPRLRHEPLPLLSPPSSRSRPHAATPPRVPSRRRPRHRLRRPGPPHPQVQVRLRPHPPPLPTHHARPPLSRPPPPRNRAHPPPALSLRKGEGA